MSEIGPWLDDSAFARLAGVLPERIVTWLGQARGGSLPWETLLRARVTSLKERRTTFRYPNRRAPDRIGVIAGKRTRRTNPVVMIAIDTSASMRRRDLDQIAAEIDRLLAMHIEVAMVQCDHEIQTHGWMKRGDRLDRVVGRGGTTFMPVFEPAFLRRYKPDLLFYFTDGGGEAPLVAPRGVEVRGCSPHEQSRQHHGVEWRGCGSDCSHRGGCRAACVHGIMRLATLLDDNEAASTHRDAATALRANFKRGDLPDASTLTTMLRSASASGRSRLAKALWRLPSSTKSFDSYGPPLATLALEDIEHPDRVCALLYVMHRIGVIEHAPESVVVRLTDSDALVPLTPLDLHGMIREWCLARGSVPESVGRWMLLQGDSHCRLAEKLWLAPTAERFVQAAFESDHLSLEVKRIAPDPQIEAAVGYAFALHGERAGQALREALAFAKDHEVRRRLERWSEQYAEPSGFLHDIIGQCLDRLKHGSALDQERSALVLASLVPELRREATLRAILEALVARAAESTIVEMLAPQFLPLRGDPKLELYRRYQAALLERASAESAYVLLDLLMQSHDRELFSSALPHAERAVRHVLSKPDRLPNNLATILLHIVRHADTAWASDVLQHAPQLLDSLRWSKDQTTLTVHAPCAAVFEHLARMKTHETTSLGDLQCAPLKRVVAALEEALDNAGDQAHAIHLAEWLREAHQSF